MVTSLQFPRMYLLLTHLQSEERSYLQTAVPSFTDDIHEADIVLGKISKRQRAEFELRRHNLETRPIIQQTREVIGETVARSSDTAANAAEASGAKRLNISSTDLSYTGPEGNDRIQVLRLSWLTDSLAQHKLLPLDAYLLYEGIKVNRHDGSDHEKAVLQRDTTSQIFRRAAEDHGLNAMQETSSFMSHLNRLETPLTKHAPPQLARQTTSENETAMKLPNIPDFLHTTYSCQRPTPQDPPNGGFIHELKEIRTLRRLQGDKIGVRAYSTAIATLSAYPYKIQSPIGGSISYTGRWEEKKCTKIAELYQQWLKEGQATETTAAALDSRISAIQLFYDIWGVGDTTAREFYRKGYRDLDDLVEYEWHSLSRVQQIGVKYYDEFKHKISRQGVEDIANSILVHAQRIDGGFEMTIVGGYRRGKKENGDVDVVLSHTDEAKTMHMIEKLVVSLEKADLITHTLSLWTKNSERGQLPLVWKGREPSNGTGFDTLDKAMVVWQNRKQLGDEAPHQRVDIIISPWKTVGCALIGWSGGTTFQRDLRRYCKEEKGLKFDSSGIRRLSDGVWMDYEGSRVMLESQSSGRLDRDIAPDMETAEKRVFRGLGLTWLLPTERCTG
ncbi:hypothetical protein QQS21_001030 [Conoideocrella luteorostrata]|uniref:DNA polymerase n=1 Tax=Conoideocrella luteorostrata TaxID=1105319 RepID=A0AAJ0D093_9HYPO|nr:hypothetical protein QQS21_001030 [Conoideocrella luteorostrata]